MIRLYGSPRSSSARTHWMIEETGVAYEYVVTKAGDGGTRDATFLARNPFGKIPFLEDGDLRLVESMAINFYLAEKYRPSLLPSTPEGRALAYQWSFWAITNVQPEALNVMAQTAFLPEGEREPKKLAVALDKLAGYLDVLDAALEKSGDYLLGDRFTVADVNAGSVVNLALRLEAVKGEWPHVRAWMDRLRARPAYQRAAKHA